MRNDIRLGFMRLDLFTQEKGKNKQAKVNSKKGLTKHKIRKSLRKKGGHKHLNKSGICLLYTSDAADE